MQEEFYIDENMKCSSEIERLQQFQPEYDSIANMPKTHDSDPENQLLVLI